MNPRTGLCEREGCGSSFIDTTPGGTRRFCSENCRKRVYDATTGTAPCIDCGGPTHDGSRKRRTERCESCHATYLAEHTRLRRERIAALWNDGLTQTEIAAELGSTKGSINVEIVRMRKDGWDLPRRRAYYGNGIAA